MADFINLDAAYDNDTLTDWYISSVGSEPPVWTDEHIEELLNDFYVIPKDTPTADVEPVRHGYWIDNGGFGSLNHGFIPKFKCSFCNGIVYDKRLYCGNCGAKMDGESNGS